MATNSVEICNNALALIGARRITALTDPSKEARTCNDAYDGCRKAVLRLHPWNFATVRVRITGKSISAVVDNGSGLIKITTSSAHGLTTGDYVTVEGVVGTVEANQTAYVTVVNSTNFTLDDSTFTNTYVSGGVVALAAAYEYKFKFSIPTGSLRVWTVSDDSDNVLTKKEYRIEGAYILTNYSVIRVKYIDNVETTTRFDALFDELLAAYIADSIAYKITASETVREAAKRDLRGKMQAARFVDSTEDPSEEFDSDEWIRSRWSTNQGYVRDPMT